MLASLKTLLGSIVDYAGLYPPAQLDLRSAMQAYAESATSPDAWMLSYFVLPASQIKELSAILPELPLPQWSLSVVVQNLEDVEQAFSLPSDAKQFPQEGNRLKIAALEFTPRSPTEMAALLPQIPPDIDIFFETPLDRSLADPLAVLQNTPAAAKARTGGITEAAFPSNQRLAEWIYACAQAKIPFKATAGLHHPFPGTYRLISESDSPTARMHGFLNVAIAAAFAYHQAIDLAEIVQLLEINALEASLQFQEDKLIWLSDRGRRQLDLAEIQAARQHFFRSFGSCSFAEPIDDLRKLGLISR